MHKCLCDLNILKSISDSNKKIIFEGEDMLHAFLENFPLGKGWTFYGTAEYWQNYANCLVFFQTIIMFDTWTGLGKQQHCRDNVIRFSGKNYCWLLHYVYIRCDYSILTPKPQQFRTFSCHWGSIKLSRCRCRKAYNWRVPSFVPESPVEPPVAVRSAGQGGPLTQDDLPVKGEARQGSLHTEIRGF